MDLLAKGFAFLLNILFIEAYTAANPPPNLTSLVAPIYTDAAAFQYTINLGSQNHSFLLDLGGDLIWYACSSNHQTVPCNSYQCYHAETTLGACCHTQKSCSKSNQRNKKEEACTISVNNPIFSNASCIKTELTYTNLTLTTYNGIRPISSISLPDFITACAAPPLLDSLPAAANGVLGLSRSGLAFSTQMTAKVGLRNKFALCLPQSRLPGVAFFGDGPYEIMPPNYLEGGSIITYAPLETNPSHPRDYYVPVKEIDVVGTKVAVNGWTKLSPSTNRYTTMATSLYKAIAAAFIKSVKQVPPPVEPFDLCGQMGEFSTDMLPVFSIDLIMENGTVCTIAPASAMEQPTETSVCLAIFDGGNSSENAIVIGEYQMQEVFYLFDQERSSVGMSQHLTYYGSACENFYAMST